jgi:hypothetical protein
MKRMSSIARYALAMPGSMLRLRRLSRRDRGLADAIRRVRAEHLTYLSIDALVDLAEAVLEIERDGIQGKIVEAGTALGGSAIVLAKAKNRARSMAVFDTFGMIPPPSDKDGPDVHGRYAQIASGKSAGIAGEVYYGYRSNLLDEVTASFERLGVACGPNNVELVPGRFEDTMQIDGPVALAHIDADWYESVATCLAAIAPRMAVGGRFVIDDYDDWSGCAAAVDDFLAARGSAFEIVRRSRVHLVRRA